MGEAGQIYDQDKSSLKKNDKWVLMGGDDSESSIGDSFSSSSNESSSSLSDHDMIEDATSSTASSSSPSLLSYGPLYELSELMANLPIKRGLSKHYGGKSKTFTSLSCVRSLEDLAKKERHRSRNIKSCKSYRGGLDNSNMYRPKAIICKKSGSRVYFLSSIAKTGRATLSSDCRPS